jgi:fibro-slime domain-containing protein
MPLSNRVRHVACCALLLSPAVLAHCGSSGDGPSVFEPDAGATDLDGGGQNGDGDAAARIGFGGCDGSACVDTSTTTAPTCGDGVIGDPERCDDGNAAGGDGCSATCAVEAGWRCPVIGARCEAAACGDGILAGAEECEHAPGATVKGCSATCRIEAGYDCDPTSFACAATVCGDGKVQRGESCEDGNDIPFDGCYKCRTEPSCANGVCKASCGDGQRFATEACDDGNTRSGDGCSSTCTVETGFACMDVVTAPPASIPLPVLLRDFIGVGNEKGGAAAHTDFNQLNGSGVLGIVETQLGANGRPVYACPGGDCTKNPGHLYFGGAARPNMSNAANFAQWYTNVAGVNLLSTVSVSLARQADGTYVWDSGNATMNGGITFFDPINTGGWVAAGKEVMVCSPARNVSFTSETHFWFEYQGGEKFAFAGDDDTWVFVNGKLAVDLGGLHSPLAGNFALDADTDGAGADTANGHATVVTNAPGAPASADVDLGLKAGGTYEVVMFQAERNQCGSNFKVTLKDFNRPKSACASTCGDGVVASDEACDDGKNDGTYGGCMPGCMARAPRCGDGQVDPAHEECDDGNTNNTDLCTNTCLVVRIR